MTLPDELLQQVSETVLERTGLFFPRERWSDLLRGVEAACAELGEPCPADCMRRLVDQPLGKREIESLGRHLTVGETYFFREPKAYEWLAQRHIPRVMASREEVKVLRLWSAACASGEEAYSLAIAARGALGERHDWRVKILATDINTDSLARAARGVYREWSFRSVSPELRSRWFTRTAEGLFSVNEEARQGVSFLYHNLVEDPYPSLTNNTNAVDVIFCRNVFMYFSEEVRRQIVRRFHDCLVEGGVLVVGAAETSTDLYRPFVAARYEDLVVYVKEKASAPGDTAAFCPAPPAAVRTTAPPAKPRPPRPPAAPPAPPSGEDAGRESALSAARSCANGGDLQQALEWVERVVAFDRTDPEGHYLKALILEEKGALEEAAAALRTTLYLDSGFIPAYFSAGNLARTRGDMEGARRNFRNALALLEPFGDEDTVPRTEGVLARSMREAVRGALRGIDEPRG
ncbi:MAG TPA: CheR family methyltransferase [Verrucomicrobiae bacterium]|nr:CheR family methyltransferase [Verrucomicrobiae bacterium]